MKTYYKIVQRYKDRLFSLTAWNHQMDRIIQKRKRKRGSRDNICKEYRPDHWVYRVTSDESDIKGRLFVFDRLSSVTRYAADRFLPGNLCNPWANTEIEVWTCEVKNPICVWECDNLRYLFQSSDGYVLTDAVKLTKRIKCYKS